MKKLIKGYFTFFIFLLTKTSFSQLIVEPYVGPYNGASSSVPTLNEAFLKGNYIEVGMSQCGSFGSKRTFANSHARTFGNNFGLGFVADPAKDGWDVGTPNYYGDFFIPGSPVEGWGIQVVNNGNSAMYVNGNNGGICSPDDIGGAITNYSTIGDNVSATWKSDASFQGGVSICQTTFFNVNDLFFTVTVKLCNTSDVTIDELYYMRSVDPDNDVTLSGDFTTDNKIPAQIAGSTKAVVTARGVHYPDAFIGLGTNNANARVAINQYTILLPQSIKDVWDGTGYYDRNDRVADVNIALAYKFVNVEPGECLEFTYAYVLDVAYLDRAVNSTSDDFTIMANGTDISTTKQITVSPGTQLNLDIVGNPQYTWVWTPTTGGAILNGANQTITPTQSITYNVVGTLSSVCSDKTVNYTITIIVSSPPCAECVPEFSPLPGQEYLLSAWVRESYTDKYPDTYLHSGVQITFNAGSMALPIMRPAGPIIEGWQRIEASFVVPATAANIQISLVNDGSANNVFFDDIRIHPFRSNMKSFVYNPSTQKVEVILDENNYSTRYEYDDEGILVRVKKETERGVMTIKETRNNQSKINK